MAQRFFGVHAGSIFFVSMVNKFGNQDLFTSCSPTLYHRCIVFPLVKLSRNAYADVKLRQFGASHDGLEARWLVFLVAGRLIAEHGAAGNAAPLLRE